VQLGLNFVGGDFFIGGGDFLSSTFLSSDLKRKQLILAICSVDFNFPVNHHQQGKWFGCCFRVCGVIVMLRFS